MGNQPPTKTEMCWSDQLRTLLDGVETLGTFATSGPLPPLPYPHPIISVDGIGRIAFPVVDTAIAPLKAVAIKASYGKGGTETLMDENVRRSWQIDATKIKVEEGPVWNECMKNLVHKVCKELGMWETRIENSNVCAKLHKMLLYEQGGHFLPHRDSEKEAGMFGTLIIQLPSEFTGASVTVKHDGESKTFALSTKSVDQFQYVAFYADCEHQLHPVESGFRVCLVYNLVAKQSVSLPSHAINKDTEAKLRVLVDEWKGQSKPVSKLGYELGHVYTPTTFGWSALKGRDQIVCQTLANAKTSSGDPLFTVHLLLMERYVKWAYGTTLDETRAIKVISSGGVAVVDVPAFLGGYKGNKQKCDADDWIMDMRADGWMVLVDEYKWHVDQEKKDQGTYTAKTNDEKNNGDRVRGKNSMFKQLDAPKLERVVRSGREDGCGPRENWYIAAAIVVSPA